jgi:glycosyltransferase involved in cell wall biosynthesis
VGIKLKRLFGLPWVADFRDPFANDPLVTSRHFLARRLDFRAEAAVLRLADAVIANVPGAADLLKRAHPHFSGNVHVITNGFDPEFFPERRHGRAETPFRILHSGELYRGRNPEPVIDAIERINARGGILGRPLNAVFYGRTDGLEDTLARTGRRRFVELHGQQPYAEAIRAMVDADILLLLANRGQRASAPAKLYEYLGAGRPILAVAEPDSDVAWVLRNSGTLFRIVGHDSSQQIEEAVTELIEQDRSAPPACRGVQFFTREVQACRLAALLDELTGRC